MEPLTFAQISEFAGGTILRGDPVRTVTSVSTDTRTLAAGELFLALRGENFDGHDHLGAAAAAGAIGAVIDREVAPGGLPAGITLIRVDDTLGAYQQLAARYRQSLALRVVGITGSNGKTSTKDLTAAILGRRFRVLKTEGNLNNHIGVPRMLLRANRLHEVAVLEMGMNHPGEIAPLAYMAAPDVAIITNIGRAHLEFMGTREAIAQEKGMLVEALGSNGTAILNGNDEFAASIARRTQARVIVAGGADAEVRAEAVLQDLSGSRFTLVRPDGSVEIFLPVAGAHMVTNALLAAAAGLALGVSLADCAAALAEAKLTKGRLGRVSIWGREVLDDTYNANPDSMSAAIETLAALPAGGRRWAVLGRMGELGDAAADGYRAVGTLAAAKGIDFLITVGEEARAIATAAEEVPGTPAIETIAATDQDDAASRLAELSRPGDLILVKGSRSAATERVIAGLARLLSPSGGSAVASATPHAV